MRLIAEIEGLVHRHRERLETPAARQLQLGPDSTHEAELVPVLVDVELELDRRHDLIGVDLAPCLGRLEGAGNMTDRLPIAREVELQTANYN